MFILCCMNRRLEAVADTSELRDEEATSEGAELNQTTTKIEAHLPSLRGHVGEDAKVGMWDGKVGLLEGPSLLSRTVSASPPSTITIKNLNPPETPTRKHVKKRSSEVPEEESVHREKKRKGLGNTHKTKEENTALGHTNRGTVEMIRGGGNLVPDTRAKLRESRVSLVGFSGKVEVPPKEKHLEEAKPSPPMENNITSKVGSEGQEAPAKACEEGRPPEQTLRKHADAFAWTPADMTWILRFIAEHQLKTYSHIEPRVQKKRSLSWIEERWSKKKWTSSLSLE
ncbi:hypothetical protein Tco_1437925 [Tanacetum coccineum]